jgi:hypothetical protein
MTKEKLPATKAIETLVAGIKEIIEKARENTVSVVNREMLLIYWQIGRLIVTKGKRYHSDREFILQLSKRLTHDLGKGFSRSNL